MLYFSLKAKGFDTSQHVLACFGGAGGQHACAVAKSLGMRTVLVHRLLPIKYLDSFLILLLYLVFLDMQAYCRRLDLH